MVFKGAVVGGIGAVAETFNRTAAYTSNFGTFTQSYELFNWTLILKFGLFGSNESK